MNKSDVAQVVRQIAHSLKAEGHVGVHQDLYIVNPMLVWNKLEETRPDVVAHLRRYHSGSDPYQVIKEHIPPKRRS